MPFNPPRAPETSSSVLDFLVEKVGLWGFIAFLAMTGVGLPIPEEAPLVLAGVLSHAGRFHPAAAFGACLIGALLGDSIMYGIGRHFGHGFLLRHPFVARFINVDAETKIEHLVHRHGFKIMLGTRFLLGVRGAVYFAAGAARVPYARFLLWDLCAATLVVGAVFGLAFLFGDWIGWLVRDVERVATAVVVLVLGIAGYTLYRKRKARIDAALEKMERENEQSQTTEMPRVETNGQPVVESPSSEKTAV